MDRKLRKYYSNDIFKQSTELDNKKYKIEGRCKSLRNLKLCDYALYSSHSLETMTVLVRNEPKVQHQYAIDVVLAWSGDMLLQRGLPIFLDILYTQIVMNP